MKIDRLGVVHSKAARMREAEEAAEIRAWDDMARPFARSRRCSTFRVTRCGTIYEAKSCVNGAKFDARVCQRRKFQTEGQA